MTIECTKALRYQPTDEVSVRVRGVMYQAIVQELLLTSVRVLITGKGMGRSAHPGATMILPIHKLQPSIRYRKEAE